MSELEEENPFSRSNDDDDLDLSDRKESVEYVAVFLI